MDLRLLSDEKLTTNLVNLTGHEREVTLQVLYHLVELENRKLFLAEGYSSLFDYCTRKLCYSESSAYRRVTGARCLRDNPELAQLFLEGKVTLASISMAAKGIKENTTKVQDIVGKSKREVEVLVTKPQSFKPKETLKPIIIESKITPLLFPSAPQEERYEIKFSVSREVYRELSEAKAKLSHSLGTELSLEALFSKLLELYLKPKGTSRKLSSSSRYIPRALRRLVYKRDNCQCSYVSPEGTRCTERNYLQFDHVYPYALGGKTDAKNLRLLCAAHNRLLAERIFGRNFIDGKTAECLK